MNASIVAGICIAVLCFVTPVNAQYTSDDLPLAEVLSKGGKKLSKEDLESLLPDAQVVSVSGGKSIRRWKNNADGKTTVSSSASKRGATATWSIGDRGTYCMEIEWSTSPTEKWCRYLFQVGTVYYGAASATNPDGKAYKLEISK